MKSEGKSIHLINRLEFRDRKFKALYILLFILIVFVSLLCILPILWVLISSLENPQQFYSMQPPVVPTSLDFSKLSTVWGEINFFGLYLNTAWVTVGSLICALLFNSILGYVLSRLKPRGTRLVFLVIMWTLMLPNTTAIVPVYKNIVDFPVLHANMMNTYFPMWLMAGASAFNVIVFKSFFDGIPTDLLEAAQMDGASNLRNFFSIIVPLSKPVLLTITIFTITGTWSDFFWPYMVLNAPSKQTVMVGIFGASSSLPADQLLLALTFGMLPPMIIFVILQKYIMQGFTLSGLKG